MRKILLSLIVAVLAARTAPAVEIPTLQQCLIGAQSDDPAERRAAESALMGRSMAELSSLRDDGYDVSYSPAQIEILESAVVYAFAHEKLKATATSAAFIGVMFMDGLRYYDSDDNAYGAGVPIRTLKGFVGARFLCDGDVILGFGPEGDFVPTPTTVQFVDGLKRYRAGDRLTIHLCRGGRTLTLTFTLDGAPKDSEHATLIEQCTRNAYADGQAYWMTHFAPFFK